MPVMEDDLTVGSPGGFDDLGFSLLNLRHRCAKSPQDAGLTFNTGCPRILVRGGDNAPFTWLFVCENPACQSVCPRVRLARPSPAGKKPGPPEPLRWQLIRTSTAYPGEIRISGARLEVVSRDIERATPPEVDVQTAPSSSSAGPAEARTRGWRQFLRKPAR